MSGTEQPPPSDASEESRRHGLAELIGERRAKRERLRASDESAFPHAFAGVEPIDSVLGAYEHLAAGDETDERHRVAGRLAARRIAGKTAFLDLVDRGAKIQLHARIDVLGPERFELLTALDLGDLIGVDGSAIRSRRGEVSLRVEGFQVLAKALRPPPDKHHGLVDVETRYRHRELDLISSDGARRLFIDRARIVSAVRGYLDAAGFIEVETPVLQPLYGGAMARPFTTHHNALDRDLYLRIATELYLKRLIVGGLERVYELGKDFRNEGVSHKHNPEFTMVEWYEAYADYTGAEERTEAIVRAAAEALGYEGELDFSAPWPRVGFVDAIREATGIDLHEFPQVDFVVAGRDTEFTEMGKTYREWYLDTYAGDPALMGRVRFTGGVSEDELYQLYCECDVFCLPSRYESFGLVLLEAMMFGKPVVAVKIGGMQEIVEADGNGFLAEPESAA